MYLSLLGFTLEKKQKNGKIKGSTTKIVTRNKYNHLYDIRSVVREKSKDIHQAKGSLARILHNL